MKTQEVTKRENELICLYNDAKTASKLFAEACQFAAEQADTSPTVVRRYVAAIAEAEQRVLLFQSMPTVQGQAA